ncbi:DUF3630 family protein [Ferrimonas kyonanensis]|uniref:DUF3630 family protein n=1 Tax=Ferrimonas kyonanensis TaxID=364763 RepID=UPI0003F936A8|nr:DUF3630 family protein [Ferrimonas kyonanensis]
MGAIDHPLLLQLSAPRWQADTGQLLWTLAADDDTLAQLVPLMLARLDCRLLEHSWGADRHLWLLEFEGCRLALQYEALCDTLWLQAERAGDQEVTEYLAQLWTSL